MQAAQLQPSAAAQGRATAAFPPAQLQPLQSEQLPGAATPLKQQLSRPAAVPAAPAARAVAARVSSWLAAFPAFPAANPAAMAGRNADLEFSEEALFREDQDGQVTAASRMLQSCILAILLTIYTPSIRHSLHTEFV